MKYLGALLTILALSACYGKKPKTQTGLEGQLMPAIDFISIDKNTHGNTANIAPGKPTIILSFEPWCPYCKAQTETLIRKIGSLKDVNIYMLAASPAPLVREFLKRYRLSNYPNITVGIDSSKSFVTYFEEDRIPFLAVYDKNKKLKEVFIGKTPISTLKKTAFD